MATQATCAPTAQCWKTAGAALLCGLGVVCAALVLAILAEPLRSDQPSARPPGACNAPRASAWPLVGQLHPAAPALPCALLRWARTDLESAEREVQSMRRV